MEMTSHCILPAGTSISTASPLALPMSALPIGDSLEILPVVGSTSLDPTISKDRSLPEHLMTTFEPIATVFDCAVRSTTVAALMIA